MSCHSTAYLPHFLQNTPETSLQGWFWNLDSTCSCSIAVISELQNILGFIIIYCIVLFHLIKNFRKTQFIRIFSGSITKILCCRWIDLEVTLQAWKVHIDGGGINYRDATCWPQDFFFFFLVFHLMQLHPVLIFWIYSNKDAFLNHIAGCLWSVFWICFPWI